MKKTITSIIAVGSLAVLSGCVGSGGWEESYENQTILEDFDRFDYVEYNPGKASLNPQNEHGAWGTEGNDPYSGSPYTPTLELMTSCMFGEGEFDGLDHAGVDTMVLWYGVDNNSDTPEVLGVYQNERLEGEPELFRCYVEDNVFGVELEGVEL